MTCKNCGAELTSDICEYCGTKYNYINPIDEYTYQLDYEGAIYEVALREIKGNPQTHIYRDVNGMLHHTTSNKKTFVFEEL